MKARCGHNRAPNRKLNMFDAKTTKLVSMGNWDGENGKFYCSSMNYWDFTYGHRSIGDGDYNGRIDIACSSRISSREQHRHTLFQTTSNLKLINKCNGLCRRVAAVHTYFGFVILRVCVRAPYRSSTIFTFLDHFGWRMASDGDNGPMVGKKKNLRGK